MMTTEETFHSFNGWLKYSLCTNIVVITLMLDTSHLEMLALKAAELMNKSVKSVSEASKHQFSIVP